MKLQTKAILVQIGWYIVFIWLMMFILTYFITNRGLLYSFIAGFAGVLLAPKIKIENGKLTTKWLWSKK